MKMIRLRFLKSSSKNKRVDWQKAQDIQIRIEYLVDTLDLDWVETSNVHCFRSTGSKARAVARIWGFNRIWQIALDEPPSYCLEVISEQYDRLDTKNKDKTLLHELAHIPKNFSGSLVPHTRKRKGSFHDKLHNMLKAYDKI